MYLGEGKEEGERQGKGERQGEGERQGKRRVRGSRREGDHCIQQESWDDHRCVCVSVSVGKCGTRNTAHGCGGYARKDPQNAHIGVHLCVHRELVQLPSTVHRAPIHWSEGDQSSYTNSLNAD